MAVDFSTATAVTYTNGTTQQLHILGISRISKLKQKELI